MLINYLNNVIIIIIIIIMIIIIVSARKRRARRDTHIQNAEKILMRGLSLSYYYYHYWTGAYASFCIPYRRHIPLVYTSFSAFSLLIYRYVWHVHFNIYYSIRVHVNFSFLRGWVCSFVARTNLLLDSYCVCLVIESYPFRKVDEICVKDKSKKL